MPTVPTQLLAGLLPDGVLASGRALADVSPGDLPEAREVVAGAVERRQREYVAGRIVAREVLAGLGHVGVLVGRGADRAPIWPRGVVGTITHARAADGEGWVLVAVASAPRFAGIGVDLEPDEPLPDGVAGLIGAPGDALPDDAPARLLFSAKEAVYKAISADAGRVLGFEEVALRVEGERLAATLLVDAGRLGAGATFDGCWACRRGWVVTAFARCSQLG